MPAGTRPRLRVAIARSDEKESRMDPVNIDSLDLADLRAADDKVHWKGAFFSYGGAGSSGSATIYFE